MRQAALALAATLILGPSLAAPAAAGGVAAAPAAAPTAPAASRPALPRAADDEPGAGEAVGVATPFGMVLVSPSAPVGQYAERYAEGFYWVPGQTRGTSLVRKVIRAARVRYANGRPVEVRVYRAGGLPVHVTGSEPFPGVFALEQDGRWAWIAGVGQPTPAQRAALVAALDGSPDAPEEPN